jgi:pimeloyl-ACP methyl ester carboxylesterase
MPFLNTGLANIHYEVAGDGAPLLFLHGLGSSTLDWERQVAAFADRFRVITVDVRGSGESHDIKKPNGPFRIEEFAKDALAVLEHLRATPAHVVGLSLGGCVAFQMAVMRPEALRTLTIVNSAPVFEIGGGGAVVTIWLRRIIARVFGPRGMATLLAPRLFPGPAHEKLRQLFVSRMARNRRGAYIATQRAVLGWTVRDQLGRIALPTLVLSAEHDYPFLANKQVWVRLMPNATYVEIAGAHHALPIEAPEPFNAELGDFLARHASA